VMWGFGPLYFSSPKPPAADPAVGQAAQQNAAVAKEALDFQKQVYQEGKPRQAELDALTDEVIKAHLGTMEKQGAQADDFYNYMKTTFRPVEQQLAADAMAFDTEGRRSELAAQAGADVEQAAAVSDAAARRDAARYGVNPADAAFADNMAGSSLNKTIMKVGAMNNARTMARNEGRAFKFDVAGMGRGLPGAGATSASLATNAGNAAVNAGTVPTNAALARAGTMNQGYNTAIAGNNSAANIYSGLYQGQLNAFNTAQSGANATMGAAGTLAGMGLYAMLSSKKAKNRKGAVKDAEVIEAAKKTKVDRWQYKKDAMPDQAEHVGPYAEDMKENFRVGDGKTINVIDAIGVNFALGTALARKLDRLEGKVATIAKMGVAHG
jgi:hypothetical protein